MWRRDRRGKQGIKPSALFIFLPRFILDGMAYSLCCLPYAHAVIVYLVSVSIFCYTLHDQTCACLCAKENIVNVSSNPQNSVYAVLSCGRDTHYTYGLIQNCPLVVNTHTPIEEAWNEVTISCLFLLFIT